MVSTCCARPRRRCLCLLAESVLYENYLCPSERTCALVRCIPDLFFLTTYSLLILFWAQVSGQPCCLHLESRRALTCMSWGHVLSLERWRV
jgi:hypothetical protein